MKTFTFYKIQAVLIIGLLLTSFLPTTVQAQKTFTGTGNFSDAARWTGGTLPVAGDNLIIDGNCTVDNSVATDNVAYGTITLGTATARTLNWAVGGTNRLNVGNATQGSAAASYLDMTNGGTLIFRGTLILLPGFNFSHGAGTIEFRSSVTMPPIPFFNNLIINSSLSTVTTSGNMTMSGNLTVTSGTLNLSSFTANRTSAGGTLTVANGATLKIGGTNTLPSNYSTHSIGATSTVEYSGTTQSVAVLNSAQDYGNLIISGSLTKTLAGAENTVGDLTISAGIFSANNFNMAVGGNWTNNVSTAAFTAGTGTVTMNGTIAKSIAGSFATTFNNLTIAASNTVTFNVNCSVSNNLLVSSGTLNLGSFTANRASAGGTLTISNGATLKIGGTNTLPSNYSTHSIGATSTIEYSGTAQSVAVLNSAQNYGNLIITGGGMKLLAGNAGVAGDLTVTSSGFLSLSSHTLNRTSAGGTLTLANGGSLYVAGNNTVPLNYSTYAIGATSTIQYNGSVQTISLLNGANYGTLHINGSTTTLPGNVGVAGNLTLTTGSLNIGTYTINRASAGGTLTVSNGATLRIGGTNTVPSNYTTHSIDATHSTVEYYGSNQTVAVLNSAQNYCNLTASGSGTKTLAGNITATGIISFNGATITTGANTLYLSTATGSVSRTTGHVVGNFRKYITTGATSKTFEIGDATNYTPAAVAFASVTTAGDLTGTVIAGDHANIGSCMIIPGRTANRNWTLTNTGIVFTTYSATFTFVAGDLDAGAAPSNFIVGKYSAGWTYPTVGAKTATTTQATGVTAFSGFQLGEIIPLPVTYRSIKATLNNKAISIDWQVGEESGIQKYEVERAADGINFSKAGEVAAIGNNSSESYQWLDVQPMTGNNYYRVRALQADGNFFLSRIVLVKMNGNEPAMNVFPNPVKNQQINIGIAEMAKGTYTLLVHNPQGLQIIRSVIDHPGGSFNQTIHLSKIVPPGMFYLQIADEKQKYGQAIFIE